MKATALLVAVIIVLSDWMTKTASGSPSASRVTVPVISSVAPVYTPGSRMVPPSSAATEVAGVRPAASL